MADKIDHTYTREIVCPYCGYEFTDSWDFDITSTPYKIECHNDDCSKEFYAYIYVERTYITNKLEGDDE